MINVQHPQILAVIPARFASTKFPGKPLVMIQGQSMVSRVYHQVIQSSLVAHAVVATDDQRIFDHVQAFGGKVVMTRADHPSGTDRCAEVAALFPDADIIVNVQGDEPFVQPAQIDLLAQTLLQNPAVQIATLAKKITDDTLLFNPNIVKIVIGAQGEALYFSRHPVPFLRGRETNTWLQHHTFYKHIGLYTFRRDTLATLAQLAPSALEIAESLEQLRWLENGFRIAAGITDLETIGIDTPEDLQKLYVQV
jgi:3-deoxy-manno-octulosonate cytidylyltransferase (CMP-KDO synthetase)